MRCIGPPSGLADAAHVLQVRAPASVKAACTTRPGIERGTLACPKRGVNTQRTAPDRRFLSSAIASSKRVIGTGGIFLRSPKASSKAFCRAPVDGVRPAHRTDRAAATRIPIATASPWRRPR